MPIRPSKVIVGPYASIHAVKNRENSQALLHRTIVGLFVIRGEILFISLFCPIVYMWYQEVPGTVLYLPVVHNKLIGTRYLVPGTNPTKITRVAGP